MIGLVPLVLLAAAVPAGFPDAARQAIAARDSKQPAAAVALFQQALRLNADWPEGWWSLGSLLYDTDNYAEAAGALHRFLGFEPRSAAGAALLGLCEYELKRYDEALVHLQAGAERTAGASPQLAAVARLRLAQLLTRAEQFEEALRVTADLAQQDPDNPAATVAAGTAALRLALLPPELPAAKQALVIAAGKAVLHAQARKVEQASAEFTELLQAFPSEPYVHYLYGSFLLSQDPGAAMAQLQRELTLFPSHVPAQLQIAFEYLKRGDAAGALPYARKAVKYEPESYKTHNALGRTLVEAGDLEGGIKELEISRQLAPASPQAHIALASAYLKAGRKEDAARERAEFQKARQSSDQDANE